MKIEKYGASWCGPCKMLDRTLEQLPKEIEIVKFDADEDEELFVEKNIKSVPVLIFYNDKNEEIKRTVGSLSIDKLKEIIENI